MKNLTVLLLLVVGTFAQYYTNSERTEGVVNLCSMFSDRESLVDTEAQADNDAYKGVLSSQLTASGNDLIVGFLDGSGGVGSLTAQAQEIALFVGPFVIGFVIILIMWMFLCCCCCCPSCCPSKCCQKPESDQYTKCELIWPTVVLVLALLMIVIVSVMGITKAGTAEQAFQATTCSIAICLDDFINGNVTTEGSFFIGLDPLAVQLQELNDNHLGTIDTALDSVNSDPGTDSKLAVDEGDATIDLISKIPTGTVGQSVPDFTYNNFDGSPGTISSTFPDTLGGVLAVDGYVYDTYFKFQETKLTVQGIMESADSFQGAIADFQSGVEESIGSINDVIKSLTDVDDMVSSNMSQGEGPMKTVTLVITAVFGVFIGLSVFGILGALMMTFCDKYSCRYLVYLVCCVFWVIGIFAFLLAILFSVFTPFLYYGCDFLMFSVESGDNFESNFGDLIGSDTAGKIKVCMPGENGDIISTVAPSIYTAVDSLQETLNGMDDFDGAALQADLNTQWDLLYNHITDTYRSTRLDFSSTSNKNILTSISKSSSYSGCTSNGFASDSWIPSIESGKAISCQSSTGVDAGSTECPDQASIQAGYNTGSGACYGCVDSFLALQVISGSIVADINTRYPGGGDCTTFATDLAALYTNYYSIKVTQWDTNNINSRLATLKARYETATTGFYDRVGTVGTTFDTVMNGFTGSIEAITDPDYGMVAGLNCLIFGEDFRRVIDVTCIRLFNVIYLLRFTLGVAGFGILFTMCCSTCSGVRHYKHSLKKGQLVPTTQVNPKAQDETMAQINMKNFQLGKR